MSNNKIAYPTSMKDQYDPSTNVTFNLSMENQELIPGSIAISGKFTYSGNNGQAVYLDPLVGAHAFIDNIIQSSDLLGNQPTVDGYGRYVKLRRLCNWDKSDAILNQGKEWSSPTGNAAWFNGQYFVIKPKISFNNASANLSYSKFGNISIQLYLPAIQNIFSIAAAQAGFTYKIEDLKLSYQTVKDSGNKGQVVMKTSAYGLHSMVSNNQIISQNVGGMVVDAFLNCFQSQADAIDVTKNPFALGNPAVTEVSFQFNDQDNALLANSYKTPEEISVNAIAAFNRNNMTKYWLDASDMQSFVTSPLVGLQLPAPINLANNRLTQDIMSNAANNNKYNCHTFYEGVSVL